LNLFWKFLTGLKWANRARSLARQRALTRAEQGEPNAQFDLGERYYDGLGLPRDHNQAFTWFLRAASQGHGRAQTNVGLMLFLGRGTPVDVVEAVRWLSLAARRGEERAASILRQVQDRVSPEQFEEGRKRADHPLPN
jgi:uncharacterized protein